MTAAGTADHGPDSPYDVEYDPAGAHGRLVGLLSAREARGAVVDLGCGWAPHAEALRDAGFAYVGFDVEERSLDAVRERGFEAHRLDLRDVDATLAALEAVRAGGGRAVAGVLAIDVVEHLVEPHLLLERLSRWMAAHPGPVLGVSVPNVSHRDVAAKLLAGRWDVTPSGLLDRTHLRFLTDRSLSTVMATCGFDEVARDDRPAPESDQRWPRRHPFLAPGTPLADLLDAARAAVEAHGETYQFIRLYEAADRPTTPTLVAGSGAAEATFLSVVAEPSLDEGGLGALRSALDAQDDDGWELVVAEGARGVAGALARCRGTHVSVVGRGEVPGPAWVSALRAGADVAGGRVVRCGVAELDASAPAQLVEGWAEAGDLAAPGATAAFPLDAVRALDPPVDGDLPPAVSLLVTCLPWCGAHDVGQPAVAAAARPALDRSALDRRLAELDRRPFLAPAGHLARSGARDAATARALAAEARVAELEAAIGELRADHDWLTAELAPLPVRLLRRALRRPATRA